MLYSLLDRLTDHFRMESPTSHQGVSARVLPAAPALEWTLRVGAFLCFVGHGAFGIVTKASWLPYFAVAGVGPDAAYALMPVIGALDIILGCLILLQPRPVIAGWMVAWALWTALLRPLAGEPVWEAFERAGNYGVPAALLLLMSRGSGLRGLFAPARIGVPTPEILARARRTLTVTTALLLLGHGALGISGKAGLTSNYASVFSADVATSLTVGIGWIEIAFALIVVRWQQPTFLLVLAMWKLATESLFLTAGAPAWEVVERGGSYVAPIALAMVVVMTRFSERPKPSLASSRDAA